MTKKPKQPTTWQLIRELFHHNFAVAIGPHRKGLRGYWASCTQQGVDQSDSPVQWYDIGHANTPYQALQMAIQISLGNLVTVPSEEEFEL